MTKILIMILFTSSLFAAINDDLLVAINNGKVSDVVSLIAQGADPNYVQQELDGVFNNTPLTMAICYREAKDITKEHIQIIRLLIDYGANVNQRVNMRWYQEDGKLDGYNGWSYLMCAAGINHVEITNILLEHNINIEMTSEDSEQLNALLWAAHEASFDVGNILIENGANVNSATSNLGSTPLIWAMNHDNSTIFTEKLIAAHADVNQQAKDDGYAITALHRFASRNHNPKNLELLIEAGAKIDLQDINGNTPLMWAASKNNIDALRSLIDHGADVNIVNRNLQTALIMSVIKNNKESVQVLIANLADLNAKTKEGKSALTYAKEKSYFEIVQMLQQAGAIE